MDVLPLEHRTLVDIAENIRRRELGPVEVTESLLERIGRLDSTVNAFISVQAEEALAAAQRAEDALMGGDRRGKLHGVPLAHKDAFQRKNKVATAGACVFDQPAGSTATVIRRLEDAATVNLGTLNLDEFAAGGTGENRHHGRCCNPWAPRHVTGGSSSGSAAAVAARFVYAALGGDAGGSIRIPAALCGVVGLKPTYGRVSRFGALPRTWSMDCIGPLARTAADCALVMEVIAGPDPEDPTAAHVDVPEYREPALASHVHLEFPWRIGEVPDGASRRLERLKLTDEDPVQLHAQLERRALPVRARAADRRQERETGAEFVVHGFEGGATDPLEDLGCHLLQNPCY